MENLSGRIFLEELHGPSFFKGPDDGFCALRHFSHETLPAGKKQVFKVPADHSMVLVPVTGELICKDIHRGGNLEVNAGQILFISNPASSETVIRNPFKAYEINYLLLLFKNTERQPLVQQFDFELNDHPNTLINIMSLQEQPFKLNIGRFEGRREATLELSNAAVFCFALSGAFEIQGRLLHAGDGLALWNLATAELEALSNNAVILIIELPYI